MNPIMFCIFCFRDETEIQLSREHVIPQCVGGILVFNYVCNDCNRYLGSQVDKEILKNPFILDGLEKLNIPHDKSGILMSYYKIKGKDGDFETDFLVRGKKYEMIPKQLKDKSYILPEKNFEEQIRKNIFRDKNIQELKIPKEIIEKEIKKLVDIYPTLKPGQFVESRKLGRGIRKRTNTFTFEIVPKSEPNVERLICKILYETLFIFGTNKIFKYWDQIKKLHNSIVTGEIDRLISIRKVYRNENDYEPLHHFRLFHFPNEIQFEIWFFNKIGYLLDTPIFIIDLWKEVEKVKKVDGIKGLHYEQDFTQNIKQFWLQLEDDSVINF